MSTKSFIFSFSALLPIGLALTAVCSGQTPAPATFVTGSLIDGGAVIADSAPIPVAALATGDFNNDGVPDLITLDSSGNSNGWGILLGKGDGTFQPVTTIASTGASGQPGSVVTGDFNSDGNLDFAVTYTVGPNAKLSIYLGNGAGGFSLKATYALLGNQIHPASGGLVAADLRGNTHLDLVALDPHTQALDVYLGNGDGTFHAPVAVPVSIPGATGAVTSGDVNHDGKPDLVVASNANEGGIYVLIGNGNGAFQSPVFYAQGSSPGAMAVAIGQLIKGDDGDVVMGTQNGAYVYINNGDGTFQTPVLYGPSWIDSIVITDVNGDKNNDLVVSSYSSAAVWVMLGNGKGAFNAGSSFATDGYPNNVVVADFNGDKKLDFAVSNNDAQWVTVGLGNGDGTFRSSESYGYTWSAATNAIATADLNGDGNLDIVQGGGGTGVGITVMLGSSHGVFGAPDSIAVGCGVANHSGVNYIALGDVNGDGKVDVVATMINAGSGCENNEIAVLEGLGNGKFKAPVYYPTGSTVQSVSIQLADFRSDGRLDIVVSNLDGSISVLLNGGTGVYGAATVIPGAGGTEGENIVIGDFNNDGKPDIAITDSGPNQINVLLGNGDGTFQPLKYTAVPISPNALAAADFNGDNKLDLALTSWNDSGSLVILLGNGDGTFTVGTLYKFSTWEQCYPSGGSNPYWMGAADLNQDGKFDLAIAVQTTGCPTQYNGENSWGAALVFIGNGDGTFNLDDGPWLGGVANSGIALGDFNDDGMTDMAVAGNASWTAQNWVTIMQNKTEPVSVSPQGIHFKPQAVNTSSAGQTVLVTNDLSSTLTFREIALQGDTGDFSFTPTCKTVAAGAECTVTVAFTPQATGARGAYLFFLSTYGSKTVYLTGTGE